MLEHQIPDNCVSLILAKGGKIEEHLWLITPTAEFSKEDFLPVLDAMVSKLKERL